MNSLAKKTNVSSSGHSRPARAELILVAIIVLVGITLRCAYPSRMSVEHFDEGVYASNLAAGDANNYHYPFQHLYAPPFLPSLIEGSMVCFGQSSLAAMFISLVVGSLTPLLLWHVGRRWFGSAAGIAAATLAALSDFHLVYSRAALTDALLCFWFLLAVYLTWEAYRSGRAFIAEAAGVATTLTWWTKYTGWLPLAVGASGLLPWLLFHRRIDRKAGRCIVQWLAIAVTAAVLWSPWWQALKKFGGYQVVSDNHARYLVGLNSWLPTFFHQASNHKHYSGWLSCAGVLLAGVVAGVAAWKSAGNFTWNPPQTPGWSPGGLMIRWAPLLTSTLLMGAAAIAFGTSAALGVAAVLGLAARIVPVLGTKARDDRECDAALAAWLTAAWFFGVLVSVPAYHPYPRLTLPWLVAAWLGTGAFLGAVASRCCSLGSASVHPEPGSRKLLAMLGIMVGFLALFAVCLWSGREVTSRGIPAWEDRADLERVTASVVERARHVVSEELHRDPKTIVMYVYGEPGIFFHVGRSDGVVAGPVTTLVFASPEISRPPVPVFLVAGPPAATSDLFAEQWKLFGNQFREVGVFHYHPSDLVLLDNLDAKALSHMAERPQEEIRLYLLK